jgi:hypothetical protein
MRTIRVVPRQVVRWTALAFAATTIGAVVARQITAGSRIRQALRAELWRVHQQGSDAAPLPDALRRDLAARLQAEMPPLRWQAAQTLGEWRDPRTVPVLLAALRDERGTQRTCRIAQALGRVGDPSAVPELVWASAHPTNIDLRMCATHALAEIGGKSVFRPLAYKAIRATAFQDRRAAIAALGDLGRVEAEIARNDASPALRRRALSALWQIGLLRGEARPRLLAALGRHEHWVRDDWILRQIAQRWAGRSAVAVNRFAAGADALWSHRLQACAILLVRHALRRETIGALEQSNRTSRILAAELKRAQPAGGLYAVVDQVPALQTEINP